MRTADPYDWCLSAPISRQRALGPAPAGSSRQGQGGRAGAGAVAGRGRAWVAAVQPDGAAAAVVELPKLVQAQLRGPGGELVKEGVWGFLGAPVSHVCAWLSHASAAARPSRAGEAPARPRVTPSSRPVTGALALGPAPETAAAR